MCRTVLRREKVRLDHAQCTAEHRQRGAIGDGPLGHVVQHDQLRDPFGTIVEQPGIAFGQDADRGGLHRVDEALQYAARMDAVQHQRLVEPGDRPEMLDPLIQVEILGIEQLGPGHRIEPPGHLRPHHRRRPDQRVLDTGQPRDQRGRRGRRVARRGDDALGEKFGAGAQQHGSGMRVEIRDLTGQAIGATDVVVIQRGDIAPARLGEPAIAGEHRAAVPRHLDQSDARIGPGTHHVARIVGRAVVDDDHLEIGEGLRLEAGERLSDQTGAVIRGPSRR
ncbi:hypothetical protein QFZ54_002408 [Sphingomonas faeni]|nr:hypothetical protein [Sphingomonas faeni]